MDIRLLLIALSKPGRIKLSKTAIALIIIFLGGPFVALNLGEPFIREAQQKDQSQLNQALDYYRAKDYDKAVTLFEQLADRGDIQAKQILGVMYAEGIIVTRDYEKSKQLLKEPADKKYKKALTTLGFISLHEGDYDLARTHFLLAVHESTPVGFSDDDYAKYGLGIVYSTPEYNEYDLKRSKRYLSQAAEAGIEEAKSRLDSL